MLAEPYRPLYKFASALPLPALPSAILKWTPGETPLSTYAEVLPAVAAYLAIIFGGQYLMTDRKAFRFQAISIAHNALLSFGSALLLALMLEEVVPIIYEHGWFYAICHTRAWTPHLETFYIINYFFKYWEFGDTLLLVAKKKPLTFLHVFHHTATALLCYTQLNGRTSTSWVPIAANLTVHFAMYSWYLAISTRCRVPTWVKKSVTSLQIIQFVLDIVVVYFATYSYFAAEYFPGQLPTMGSCAGTEGAAVFGCGLLTSYLFLFVGFYRKTYKSKNAQRGAPKAKAQ